MSGISRIMPIQAPQWADYLNCGVCGHEYSPPAHCPISLNCGHTLCRNCLLELPRKQCPFDQSQINTELEELVVNTALLFLAGYIPPAQPFRPLSIQALPSEDQRAFDIIVNSLEELASYVKYYTSGQGNNNDCGCRLSRPMQRKLMALVQCGAPIDSEGRSRVARVARSLAERTVTELILQHQNPQQLSVNLWAAVRARGCQFLGPAMQEEVLKLVLLALEDGTALSRKVLVMFVVQRLEAHFPQASKTSVGHVVQLLYRASCFKVSKRERDSSLMQLKEEFRTYETLRREHDAQIVQIATESGLRIGPDQWSALLYGDTTHKSHMQSIIDKMQIPQTLVQSVQELILILHRTGDQNRLLRLHQHLDKLVFIDSRPDAKNPSWQILADNLAALKEIVAGYLQHQPTPVSRDGRTQHNNGRTDYNSSNGMDAISYYSNNETCVPITGVYETERVVSLPQRTYPPLMDGGSAPGSAPYGIPMNEPGYPTLQLQLPEPQPMPAWPHMPHVNLHPAQQQAYYQLAGPRGGPPMYAQFVPPMQYSPWPVMRYQPPEFQMNGNAPWQSSFQPTGDYPPGYRCLPPNLHVELIDGVRHIPWAASEQASAEMTSQQHLPPPPLAEWFAPPPSGEWLPILTSQTQGAGDDNADDVELEIRLGEMEQRLGHVLDTAEA